VLGFEHELCTAAESSALEMSYELLDGFIVTIGNERYDYCLIIVFLRVADVEHSGSVLLRPFSSPQFWDSKLRVFMRSRMSQNALDVANWNLPSLNSIVKCNLDLRRDLYANVVLSGGSTMLPGISDHMQKELGSMVPNNIKVGFLFFII
jgi:actin beta/gamma 1